MKGKSVLVDTNVFINYLRAGKNPAVELTQIFDSTQLITCGVVKAEVLRGMKSVAVRKKAEEFFDIMRFVNTSHTVWNETIELAWKLDRLGRVLPLADICIAACALRTDSAVFTNDKHFDHIPGLEVVRPD